MINKRDYATATELRELIKTQDYKCALTGRDLTPRTAACDHVIAVSKGGSHRIENIQIVHAQVNTAKGTLTHEEFVAMCCEVADHV